MTLSHLLDTSVLLAQVLKPKPVEAAKARWEELGDTALAVSIICEAELLYGLRLQDSAKLYNRYENYLKDRLAVLLVDRQVANTFAEIKAVQKKKGKLIPDFDLLIAATARAHDLIVATLNTAHFTLVEGIEVENWGE